MRKINIMKLFWAVWALVNYILLALDVIDFETGMPTLVLSAVMINLNNNEERTGDEK